MGQDTTKAQFLQDLVSEHAGALERFLARKLDNPADAAEVAQETFLRIYRLKNPQELDNAKTQSSGYIGYDTQLEQQYPIIRAAREFVGDRTVDTLGPTVEAMQAAGLTVVARASADRPDHARERIRIEHFVVGERPGA